MSRAYRTVEAAIIRGYRHEAWERQGHCCIYCFEPLAFEDSTADHVYAKSKGGTNQHRNIVCACSACNMAKGSWNVRSFRAAIKDPPPGSPLWIRMAWARRRINLALHRMHRRLFYALGLENPTPIGRKAA